MPKRILNISSTGEVLASNPTNADIYVPDNNSGVTVVVDDTLPTITATIGGLQKTIHPFTEQLLGGTAYGSFRLNESVFQSTITPVIVNNYASGGVTAPDFVPTIGTVGVSGEIGVRAGQFKGTLLDLAAQKAAGIRLPAFGTSASATPYFLLEGWMYLETTPSSNYDPIIVTRSADGINNSTNDSFRLEYDTTSNQVQFHYSDTAYASAGYQGIVNVSPAGVTVNQWNHFAVAWASSGGSASIKTYWNGTSLYSAAGLCGAIRNSTAPLMVGSGASGDYPFKGWLDDVHIRMGGVSLALADYSRLGSTAPHVWEQDYAGDYTVYHLTMTGPLGESLFPVDNLCRVVASVSYTDTPNGVVGASMVIREDSDVTGLTLFDGVCGGFTTSGGSGGYVFGYDSGACMIVSGVTQTMGITAARTVRQNAADYTTYFLFGVTVMQGFSGNSGDFPLLFSGWTGGNTYSFFPIQSNVEWLRNAYDNIVVVGHTGNTVIEDYYGTQYNFRTGDVARLYQDVITYKATGNVLRYAVRSAVSGATTHTALNGIQGFTTEAAVKIAPTVLKSGSGLLFSPKAKITKSTTIPEKKNTKSGTLFVMDEPEFPS